jgi:hypothetical protein
MPEIPETPGEVPLAEVAAVIAETAYVSEAAEENAPMLEPHSPHQAVHNWKDALIHIAIITVGLLIAVGLEQTVEYFHHRHQAEHTREILAAEMASNDRIQEEARYFLAMHEDYLFKDFAVLDRLRRHVLQPTDRIVLYHPPTDFADSAWQTAQQSGAIALLSYGEIQSYARLYSIQTEFGVTMADSMNALQNTNTMFYSSAGDRFDEGRAARKSPRKAFGGGLGDAAAHFAFEDQSHTPEQLQRLRPEQVNRLEQTIQEAIYQDEKLLNRCLWLSEGYHKFIK